MSLIGDGTLPVPLPRTQDISIRKDRAGLQFLVLFQGKSREFLRSYIFLYKSTRFVARGCSAVSYLKKYVSLIFLQPHFL